MVPVAVAPLMSFFATPVSEIATVSFEIGFLGSAVVTEMLVTLPSSLSVISGAVLAKASVASSRPLVRSPAEPV